MSAYIDAVKAQFKDWKVALLVIIFTVARVIYGWSWLEAGIHKLSWFGDGKLDSAGLIQGMITNLVGPKVTHFDPLYLNNLIAWIAKNIFLGMPAFTDALVVIFEFAIGLTMIFGLRIFWSALVAMFMNTQFMAAGSFNNYGYIWTNLAMLKFAKYAELIGVDGFLSVKKNKQLLQTGNKQKTL